MQNSDSPQLCLCTCPDNDTAQSIATRLVQAQLAACVNIVPAITSVYHWQGALQCDAEVLLLIKTTSAQLSALKQRLPDMHPYQTPELIALAINDGLPAYLKWLADAAALPLKDV